MRKLAANLGVLAATLLLLAGLGELLLRAAPERLDAVERDGRTKYRFNPYRPDGILSYRLRPDWETVHETDDFRVSVRTNALGLRGGPAEAERPPGTYRILVLGDSFAFGWGVEDDESFAARLEGLLAASGGRRVEVLNAAVPGWSADHYWLFLGERGFALDPDLVLLAPYDNDLEDLGWSRIEIGEDGLPERTESLLRMIDRHGRMRYVNEGPVAAPALDFPGRDWLADHSALYHWLRFRLAELWVAWQYRSAGAERAREAGEPPEAPVAELPPAEIARGIRTGRDFQYRYHRHVMEHIARAAEARGVEVRTVLAAGPDRDEDADHPEARLHRDCRADPRCLDTARLFPESERERFYFERDGHWTPAAHARVAGALADWLAGSVEPLALREGES